MKNMPALKIMTLLPLFLLAPAWGAAQEEWNLNAPCSPTKREVRAVWLTTLSGLDWPKRPATTEAGARQQRQELCAMLDRLQRAGINTVLFQARIRSTTAYPSAIEPWDAAFTGEPGRAPLYDPLAFALEECHKRNMELHAWVVAFPICKVAVEKQLGSRALPRRRPELCQRCGDQWMMDPGVPGADQYIASVCEEIVLNYDVDGIHLDYIRYPEKGIPFNDSRTYKKYGAGQGLSAWRTENVNRCVRAIHRAVKAVRPWVKLSCSPVGKYADLPRQSSYGWNARDAVCQDAQGWLRDGLMDMLFPMMYFDGKHFYPFALDWQEHSYGRPVVPGLGIYFLSGREKDWPLTTVRRQLNFLRSNGLGGQAYFRTAFLTGNVKGIYDFVADGFYARPALPPPMTWADSTVPPVPQLDVALEGARLRLAWLAVEDETPVCYNVYRVCGNDTALLAQRLRTLSFEHVPALPAMRRAGYAVTAVDAYGNESPLVAKRAVEDDGGYSTPAVADTLLLPAVETAEYALVTDIFGRHVKTCRYGTAMDVSSLPSGCYEVRTLNRKGASHRVAFFRKK